MPCAAVQIQFVGHFDDPEEAARAYDRAVLAWRADKAVTNFPREAYEDAGDLDPPEHQQLQDHQQPNAEGASAQVSLKVF